MERHYIRLEDHDDSFLDVDTNHEEGCYRIHETMVGYREDDYGDPIVPVYRYIVSHMPTGYVIWTFPTSIDAKDFTEILATEFPELEGKYEKGDLLTNSDSATLNYYLNEFLEYR